MHSPVDKMIMYQHRTEIRREVTANRLAGELRAGRVSEPRPIDRLVRAGDRTGGGVLVRWGLAEDEEKVAVLLQLNGMSSRLAVGETFVVAEENGEVVAALRYKLEPKRLALGMLVADPWRAERRLAVALYAEAKRLAQELGAVEVRAQTTNWGRAYAREAGYRRNLDGWRWQGGDSRHQTNHRDRISAAPAA
jgi:hypothetical protein